MEATALEEVTLWPEDGFKSKCKVARADGRVVSPGHYRVSATAIGWQDAAFPKTLWQVEIREPSTPIDRRRLHFTEGDELFQQNDYIAAAEQFELARAADPSDAMNTMALARTYERLTRYREAAALLEGLLPLAQQKKLDEVLARAVTRQLAITYVAEGREDAASVLLRRNGFTPDEAGKFIATARSNRANRP